MADPLRFALIGASSVAYEHGLALQRCPGSSLAIVCSRDPHRASALASRLGVEATSDYDAILADPRIQAVDVVTEPGRHAALGMMALRHGKHLFVEKPLDVDLDAAGQLVELASRSSLCASVIAPKRFDPVLLSLRQQLASGAIGAPLFARVTMRWHRSLSYYAQPPGWRSQVGVLLNQAIHWLDALIWLFGFPEEIQAIRRRRRPEIECEDTAVVCMSHPGGVASLLAATTACARSVPDEFRVDGEAGELDYRRMQVRGCWARGIRRLRLIASGAGQRAHVSPLLAAQVRDFVESIRQQRPPQVPLSAGYEALRLVKACESAGPISPAVAHPPASRRNESTGQ